MRIRTLLGEPMLHFLLIGIALFVAYRWMAPGDSAGRASSSPRGWWTTLSPSTWRRGARTLSTELNHLIESYVRDEILYREGVKLGLDRDDLVVKRRVRQNIELMAEEDASTRVPTDADLSAYLAGEPGALRSAGHPHLRAGLSRTAASAREWCGPWRFTRRPCGRAPTPRRSARRRCCRIE